MSLTGHRSFLVLRKPQLLVRFFIFVVWCGVWVSYVFLIFCITSFGDCTYPQHQKTTMETDTCYTTYNLGI